MDLIKWLENPGREYTPVPFWFLNGELRNSEIRRQLQDFHNHGVYGVVLHPRIGLPRRIGYLSPRFFSYIRTAVETAAELNMTVVLYDEGMYPSGSACGLVVKDHPELASRGLALTEELKTGDTPLCRTERGILAERFSGGTLRGIHFGQDDGEPDAPLSADILNPEAVNRFIALTHEAYYRELGEYFGTTVIGFFTDEPSILGRNVTGLFPWTAGFADLFTRSGGSLEGLTALFEGKENEDTRLYHRLILQREEQVYYGSLSRWCEQHGIALMGHPHQSDDIEVEKYFHIPGQDLVLRWVAPEKGGLTGMDTVMGKCSADMAWWMGRRRNSNECFGACNRDGNPWEFTGSDMKWYTDWLAVRGVNLFIPHAFYYSLRGKRSGERPPDVGPGSLWWPYYSRWSAYMRRLSALLTEGEVQASAAVPCRNRRMDPETVRLLYETRRGFRYLPESLWKECREENGELVCRERRFRTVVGPENLFPAVPHGPEAVEQDCLCDPEQTLLRCARLRWRDRELWFLVNEGEEALETALTLLTDADVGRFDLWEGRAWRQQSEKTPRGRKLALRLERRESLLLFACSGEEWSALEELRTPAVILSGEDFTLVREDRRACTQEWTARVPAVSGDVLIRVEAPEMVEVFVGSTLAGAAFWAPQMIRVPERMLRLGDTLHLVVTGSLANRYGVRAVEYGMKR